MATLSTTPEKMPEEVTSTQSPSSMNINVEEGTANAPAELKRALQGRHMQMLAIGMALFRRSESLC